MEEIVVNGSANTLNNLESDLNKGSSLSKVLIFAIIFVVILILGFILFIFIKGFVLGEVDINDSGSNDSSENLEILRNNLSSGGVNNFSGSDDVGGDDDIGGDDFILPPIPDLDDDMNLSDSERIGGCLQGILLDGCDDLFLRSDIGDLCSELDELNDNCFYEAAIYNLDGVYCSDISNVSLKEDCEITSSLFGDLS